MIFSRPNVGWFGLRDSAGLRLVVVLPTSDLVVEPVLVLFVLAMVSQHLSLLQTTSSSSSSSHLLLLVLAQAVQVLVLSEEMVLVMRRVLAKLPLLLWPLFELARQVEERHLR